MKSNGILYAFIIFAFTPSLQGQWNPGGFGPGGGRQTELLDRFDADGDGMLDDAERKKAREHLEALPGRFPRAAGETRAIRTSLRQDLESSRKAAVDPSKGLYDETVLRTLYLRFGNGDWFGELEDFYNTDVEVPADLIVDGKLYGRTGVGFRGSSSYRMTGGSLKKSFNISIDASDGKQRLYGHRTLNLLNANTDPTFVREVLYARIARAYIPAPGANFVRLVVNGENWGLYVNVEQFNSDFTDERFGGKGGRRWKVPAGRGGAGLTYRGEEKSSYEPYYELKTKDEPEAWTDLIRLTRALAETPIEGLEAALAPLLDIDAALRFLALENVFIDGDGYVSRGSDFLMYQEPGGRFHLIPYDNNETFSWARGGGPNDWSTDGDMLPPLPENGPENKPLISRLLEVPKLRERYLAYVSGIAERWLDWKVTGPIVREYRKLIEPVVRADDKKLYADEAFASGFEGGSGQGYFGAPSLREFIERRREYLHSQASLSVATAGT